MVVKFGNTVNNMTQETKDRLTKQADQIQPHQTFDKFQHEIDEKSKEVYHEMEEFYKKCFEKDISFQLFFTLPEEYRPIHFWRVCEIDTKEGEERYQKTLSSQYKLMYEQLWRAGFIEYLEQNKIIKVLDSLGLKTNKEILDNAVLD